MSAALSPSLNLSGQRVEPCPGVSDPDVGAVLRRVANIATERELSPAELDSHIADCAHLMERAMEQGNRQEAEGWQQAMYAAIGSRAPEHQQRMEDDVERRIRETDESVGFFSSDFAQAMGRTGGGR